MSSTPPVVCTLTDGEATQQLAGWQDLRTHALRVEALPTGVRMAFPPAFGPLIADLVERESACCSFLDIVTSESDPSDAAELEVDITSTDAGAIPVIAAISGLAS